MKYMLEKTNLSMILLVINLHLYAFIQITVKDYESLTVVHVF